MIGNNQAEMAYGHEEWTSEDATWAFGFETDSLGRQWTSREINYTALGFSMQFITGSG